MSDWHVPRFSEPPSFAWFAKRYGELVWALAVDALRMTPWVECHSHWSAGEPACDACEEDHRQLIMLVWSKVMQGGVEHVERAGLDALLTSRMVASVLRDQVWFARFCRNYADRVWRLTLGQRTQAHLGRACRSRTSPLNPCAGGRPPTACSRCGEDHGRHMMQLWSAALRKTDRSVTFDLDEWLSPERISSEFTEVGRKRRTEQGGVAKPTRSLQTDMFVALLPDEIDRRVLTLATFFALSDDPPDERTMWPFECWADKLRISLEEARERLQRALDLTRHSPHVRIRRWIANNVDDPMSRRRLGNGGLTDRLGRDVIADPDSGLEEEIVERLAAKDAFRTAQQRVTAGEDAQTVLREVVTELWGSGTLRRIEGTSGWTRVLRWLGTGGGPGSDRHLLRAA